MPVAAMAATVKMVLKSTFSKRPDNPLPSKTEFREVKGTDKKGTVKVSPSWKESMFLC